MCACDLFIFTCEWYDTAQNMTLNSLACILYYDHRTHPPLTAIQKYFACGQENFTFEMIAG